MKHAETEGSTKPDSIKILNSISDIEDSYVNVKAEKIGEVKKMLAWWDGRSVRLAKSVSELKNLPPRTEVRTKVSAAEGVVHESVLIAMPIIVAAWCVAVNEGGGFRIVDYLAVEYALRTADTEYSATRPPLKKASWGGPPADLLNWFELRKDSLLAMCHQMVELDPSFGAYWQSSEGKFKDRREWPVDNEVPQPVRIALEALGAFDQARYTLKDQFSTLFRSLKDQTGFDALISLRPFLLLVAKQAHYAGEKAKELSAIISGYGTLSTLGAAKGLKRKVGDRSKFILEQDASFTARYGKAPSTVALMRLLDGKTDPQSRQKITTSEDEDGTLMIQWADDEKQTQKQFASKVSELRRKKAKKPH